MTNPRNPTAARARKSASTLKALVVDDDPFQLELIADQLRGLGVHDIVLAGNADQALAAQARHRGSGDFDLLLTDLYMPGKDGFQLMAGLADAGFKGAVIIFSGQDRKVIHSASLVAQLRRFEVLGTLQKPVEPPALGALVAKITY